MIERINMDGSSIFCWVKRLVVALLFAAVSLGAQSYSLGPDSQPQDGVPKGTVTKHVLAAGVFYPGTPHNYAVYVPAQYDAKKPTAFMVFLDGSGYLGDGTRVPVVLDNLIAKHEVPPMIGIFVDPGVLPAISAEAQSRFERIFEYDSLSDRYSRFLLEELIPAVAKEYNLSTNPDDRGIAGTSTGAVGAFMAAWNRPDQFHRVLSFIGTYVAMKGADELPALVRKTEPKPIRIFMQDGTGDHIVPAEPYGTSFAGSWPINNRVMFEALQYSGYDARLEMGTEAHNMKQGGAIMPDALRWLWRGYPEPIVVREPPQMKEAGWDPRAKVYSAVWADKPWVQVGGSYGEVVSPTGDEAGDVFFADGKADRIYKADADGKVSVFKKRVGGARALRDGPGGVLYAYQAEHHQIVAYAPGGEQRVVARGVDVSDMAVTAKSMIYFSDAVHKTIGSVDGSGKVRVVYQGGEIAAPMGVGLSGDQAMLVVSDAQGRFSWSFQIAADGTLGNGEPFYRLEAPEAGWNSGVKSVVEDSIGQVYFATPFGVQMCEANGRMAAVFNPPEHGEVSSAVFAGKKMDWMYVAEGGRLYRRQVKVTGVAAWSLVKLPKPPL
jgi:sugar lactone lactonase YvrE/predicted esterase